MNNYREVQEMLSSIVMNEYDRNKLTELLTQYNSKIITIDGKVDEAPKDGNTYVRKDGEWIQLGSLTGYEDIYSYGVEWDTTVTDPHLIRIGNPLMHKTLPIQSMYRGCVAKGKNIQYYLKSTNWNYKEDGTDAKLDGTDGDVKVHIPKFYGKSYVVGTKRQVRIAPVKIDDTWIEIPEMLVDAYKITIANNVVRSVVNTTSEFRGGGNRESFDTYLNTDKFRTDLGKPRTAISLQTVRKNLSPDSEVLCYEFYKWIFYWNYVIEYANFNSQDTFIADLTPEGYHQGGLGAGVTTWDWTNWGNYNSNYSVIPCGYCNELGNGTGLKELVIPKIEDAEKPVNGITFKVPRWRGFDNIFGDVYTNLEGIILKRDTANESSKVYTTSDKSKFNDSIEEKNIAGIEIAKDGYIKEFDLGEKGEIIPSEIGASPTTGKTDYHYCAADVTYARALWVGGPAHNGDYAGVGSFYSAAGVGYAIATVGFRTIIRL